jgi:hypothetical protein
MYEALEDKHVEFIGRQQMFFVGTAGAEGFINVSPKGMDSFRILDNNTVAWLNLTGSGNESAAHVLENGRMTIMFCSFDKQPLIMRLYGRARAVHPRDDEWPGLSARFPEIAGARQIFVQDVELVQTSCGYAVPRYDYTGQRETLRKWAENKGEDGIRQYWEQNNTRSLDGKDTGIF